MRRRKLIVAAVTVPAVLVAAGVVLLWPPEDRITRENCDRIHEGMTRSEVEAILGSPGDYRTGRGEEEMQEEGWSPDNEGSIQRLAGWQEVIWAGGQNGGLGRWGAWFGDSVEISVVVDVTDQVRKVDRIARRLTQGPLDNLLWRVKRRWRKSFPA
jgi:hypothetical protein